MKPSTTERRKSRREPSEPNGVNITIENLWSRTVERLWLAAEAASKRGGEG